VIGICIQGASSPRLVYICNVIFDRLLECSYRIIIGKEASAPGPPSEKRIYYSFPAPAGTGSISMANAGLLFETEIRQEKPRIARKNCIELYFSNEEGQVNFDIGFDLFSSAFYLLTEYEHHISPEYDVHGRYKESRLAEWYAIPALHEYAALLAGRLGIPLPKRKFSYEITFDIDAPWLYRAKPLWLNLAGMTRDLLRLRLKEVFLRTEVIAGAKDPYNVYDEIFAEVPVEKLVFFFLIDRNSDKDERYTHTNKPYRALILQIKKRGAAIGIHPSYTSYLDEKRIVHEKKMLEEISGAEVNKTRMHFLKYRLPETYRYLEQSGIREDYTGCPVNGIGFKHFIALPFPWFDLLANRESGLMLHPTMAMDRSLQKYMRLDPQEAVAATRKIINTTMAYGGHFVLLLHNNSLSEQAEWKGWKKFFTDIVHDLKSRT
jgi:hypothetical protein